MEVQHSSYQKVNEKWLTIQFDAFDLSFIFFIEMSEVGCAIFYMHQISGTCTGVCGCDRMHQMEKTENC